MTRRSDDNAQWHKVDHSKQPQNPNRNVQHTYRVFKALSPFVTRALPARVTGELRRRRTINQGIDVNAISLSGRDEGLISIVLTVLDVPRRQYDGVVNLLAGINIKTEPKSIERYVDPSRYASIVSDMHASAFFDYAKRLTKVTIIVLPGEDEKELLQRVVSYLSQAGPHQHRRIPTNNAAAPREQTFSNVAALPFQGRIDFSIASTATMLPDDAKEALCSILHELEASDPYDPQNIVWFYINLSKLEYHYLLACLGEFESNHQKLIPATDVRDAVKLCRSAQDQFFTDRHPGVERDDVVTLTANATGKVFRTVVSYVQKNELWLVGNILPEPDARPVRAADQKKKKPKFELRRSKDPNDPDTLAILVQQHETFQVIFDSEKFGAIANKREKFACKHGDSAYDWLTGTSGDQGWKADVQRRERSKLPQHHEHRGSDSDGCDDPSDHRQPTRQERGGRGRRSGAGAPRAQAAVVVEIDEDIKRLDSEQQLLVSLLSDRPLGLRKVRLVGPGGTGKTEALCCAVKKIVCERPQARVLYLAFSRNACDVAARRLRSLLLSTQFAHNSSSILMRLHAASSHPLDSDPSLLPYTNMEDPQLAFEDLTSNSRFLPPKDCKEQCAARRVVVTTLSVAMGAADGMCSNEYGRFDVIIVDEAAQCGLLEGLVAPEIANCHGALLVLAADQKQKAPLCLFPQAKKHMHHSLFAAADQGDSAEVLLRQSHRASAALADLLNQVVYDGRLETTKDAAATAFPLWKGHRNGRPTPSRAIHVVDDGATVSNGAEMEVVVNCVETLIATYNDTLKDDDFVVLTEYKEQQKLIRERLQMVGLKNILVTDAGSFQGDERKVVLVSLVNNVAPSVSPGDRAADRADPFPDPRTLQTMVTRAKDLVIIVGNCNALMRSTHSDAWRRLLENEHTAIESGTTAEFQPTWTSIKLQRAVPVKDFVPLKDRKKKLEFDALDLVLKNPEDYFVGVVVGQDERLGCLRVRNPNLNYFDVFVEQDFSNKNELQWDVYAFTGDLVAVRLDAEIARWVTVHTTSELIQFRAPVGRMVLPPPPSKKSAGIATQIRRHANVHLVDNFRVKPHVLFNESARVTHPRGIICCIVQRADVRSIPGHVHEDPGRPPIFVPNNTARYPSLVCEGHGTLGRLVRTKDRLPYYHVSQTAAHKAAMSPSAAVAPITRLPSALPPVACTVYHGMQCGVDVVPAPSGHGGGVTVFACFPVALIAHVTLPMTTDTTAMAMPPINKTDVKLRVDQSQPVLQMRFRLAHGCVEFEQLSCRIVEALPRHAAYLAPPPLGDFTERIVNHAAAVFLLKHLHALGLFVREDYMVCNNYFASFVAIPEIWMQPEPVADGMTQGALCAPAGEQFPIMTHVTQFESYYLDQVVLVLMGIATKLQDQVTLSPEETIWLKDIPATCVTMNGWLNSGADELRILPPI